MFLYFPMQNVMPASSVRAASSHVTVQVGDRVTPGPESAASGVLQDSTEIDVSTVRQRAASIQCITLYKCNVTSRES